MLVIAHRGASAAFPENTLAAFSGAVAQGADGVELDVRRTADGRLALSHDDTLPDGTVVVETRLRRPPGRDPRPGRRPRRVRAAGGRQHRDQELA